ncbi:MAG: cytochrome b/b6 domain-containing protein [Candidatus Nanopelagicales bacterium]
MAAATPPPSDGTVVVDGDHAVLRFTPAERWIHRTFGLLMAGCLITAALLYLPGLSGLVGQRDIVKLVHEVCGFALPVPLLIGYALSSSFRADVRRLNRFGRVDREWLRPRHPGRAGLAVGKFNAGQKLNAAFTLGAVLVMLATGAMLTFPDPFADRVRTGATFTHDWLALAIAVVLVGHMAKALADEGARRGMRTGWVSEDWIEREHSGWLAELEGESGQRPAAPS